MIQPHRFGAAFDPASLSPSLWLKGDGVLWQDSARATAAVADGDPVGSWDDASGNGRHAQQATSMKRFLLKTGANGLNALPVLRSDGVDDTLDAIIDATATQTIMLVTKKLSAPSGSSRTVLALAAAADTAQLYTNTANGTGYHWYLPTAGDDGTPTNWNIIALTFSSLSALQLRVGGGAGTAIACDDRFAAAIGLNIGGGGNFADHDVAEVFRVSSALSLLNLNLLGNHLATKYGLTWTTAT